MQHRTSFGRAALAVGTALGLTFAQTAYAQTSSDQGNPDTDPIMSIEGANPNEPDGSSQSSETSGDASGSASTTQPSNEVGEQFELPRYSEGNQVELISGLCGIQMEQMSEAACTCLAEQSIDGLSDPQRDYLIATVVAPPVSDRMMRDGRVNESDQAEIFGFLETYSETCRNQTASNGGSSSSSGSGSSDTSSSPQSPAADGSSNSSSGSGSNESAN